MTAGLWSLQQLSPKIYRHMAALTMKLAAGFADAARDAGVALQVDAFGSTFTPFFTTTAITDYQSAVKADTKAYGRLFHAMLDRGIYPPPRSSRRGFSGRAHREGRRGDGGSGPRGDASRGQSGFLERVNRSPAACPSALGGRVPAAGVHPCPLSRPSCRRRQSARQARRPSRRR